MEELVLIHVLVISTILLIVHVEAVVSEIVEKSPIPTLYPLGVFDGLVL
jgi:hypothetical protein